MVTSKSIGYPELGVGAEKTSALSCALNLDSLEIKNLLLEFSSRNKLLDEENKVLQLINLITGEIVDEV